MGLTPRIESIVNSIVPAPRVRPEAGDGNEMDEPEHVPLALQQESLWTSHRLLESYGGVANNVRCYLRIRKPVTPRLVESALRTIAARHQILRTTFVERDHRGYQVVQQEFPSLRVIEGKMSSEAEWQRIAAAEARTKFDLELAPPWRASMVSLDDDSSLLLITLHHIISDGWSVGILQSELAELIVASEEGRDPDLPKLPVQYRDYVCWQEKYLKGGPLRAQLAYWMQRLENLPLGMMVRTEDKAALTGQPSVQTFVMGASTAEALSRACKELRATTFMGLLAVFRTALSLWSGQDDVVISSPVLGRKDARYLPLIGCFYNTILLRFRCHLDSPSKTILAARDTVLGALVNQDTPPDIIIRAIWLEEFFHGNTRPPLVQAIFRHDELRSSPMSWMDEIYANTEHVVPSNALSLDTTSNDDGTITGFLHFDATRFEETRIEGLIQLFHEALDCITSNRPRTARWHEAISPHEPDRLLFRGLLIEKTTLEYALSQHPTLAEVTVGLEGEDQSRKLVAWVVLAEGCEAPSPDQLRGFLKEQNAWFGLVPTIEVVRRGGGPDEDCILGRREPPADHQIKTQGSSPQTPLEHQLATIFCEVLGRAPENVHDHVFALGGDLLAVHRIIERATREGLRLTKWSLEDVSVAGLASKISN